MSANRKLQAEVQATLKKVEEGVLLFDDIWGKVYAAGQQALKEKYEGDLKKEIKKLQRLRDQIKTWIGSSEIKDKSQLIEARKVIESKMEQFKVCEKDTKTKAFSKEGLAREARLDPKEAEKDEKITWLNANMDKLNDLIDSLEADLEKLSKGKNKNKEQSDNLSKRIKKYKWHVLRLDQLIKLIDNDDLDPSKIDSIKDDVEYFIENAAEDDSALGVDDEFDIYEELQLDTIPVSVKNLDGDEEEEDGEGEGDDEKPSSKAAKKGVTPVAVPVSSIGKIQAAKGTPAPTAKPVPVPVPVPVPAPKLPANQPMAAAIAAAEKKPTAAAVTKSPSATAATATNVPAAQPLPQPRVEEKPMDAPPLTSWASAATQNRPTLAQSIKAPQATTAPPATSGVPPPLSESSTSAPITMTSVPARSAGPAHTPLPSVESAYPPLVPPQQQPQQQPQQPQIQLQTSNEAKLGAINPEIMIAINMLKQSMLNCPFGPDSDKPAYTPRNQYPTHPAFPTQPPSIVESPLLFEKLPMDTLFLAFYHQQGLLQQVLAAKQLKKQSWRFHKKYMTWFQRHEEPKRTEPTYEEGTYVYFDYESGEYC